MNDSTVSPIYDPEEFSAGLEQQALDSQFKMAIGATTAHESQYLFNNLDNEFEFVSDEGVSMTDVLSDLMDGEIDLDKIMASATHA